MPPNDLEQFLKGTEDDQVDPFSQPLVATGASEAPTTEPEGDDEPDEDGEFKPKNRRERRLMRKLDAERQSSQFLAGKVEALAQAKTDLAEEPDYLKSIERIYGTESPEALMATELLRKAIVGARDDAETRAYNRLTEARQAELQAEQQATALLNEMVDEIEDTYDVELSDAQERSFFQLLEKMSPKDKEGNVTAYADHHTVWELFKERSTKKSGNSQAKQLASRSLTPSTATAQNDLQSDVMDRFLRDNGII